MTRRPPLKPELDAPRPRSGKHKHAGVLVRAPEEEREAWARSAARAGLTRVDFIRVACRLMENGVTPRAAAVVLSELDAPAKKDRAKKG